MNIGGAPERRSRYNRELREYVPELPSELSNFRSSKLNENQYQRPIRSGWKPLRSYEDVQFEPVPLRASAQRLVQPGYRITKSALEPLRFPNLVTSFHRDPEYATRAALYTRYTEHEWNQNSFKNCNQSDEKRNFSERLRNDIMRTMRTTDEITAQGQRDAGRRLGERLNDITFWRNELATEKERLMDMIDQLNHVKRKLEKAISGLDGPLHVTQECLYHREKRPGIELVHDRVEKSLLEEFDLERQWQLRYEKMLEKVKEELKNCRAAQHQIETDMKNKENAHSIDNACHQLNNYSKDINYYDGIERYDPTTKDHENWCRTSEINLQKSQSQRNNSQQAISEAESLINAGAGDLWNRWSNTDIAYARRITETLDTKNKLQLHLHKVQQEIFDVEKTIELLNKAIMDKCPPLKVAQTRLQNRTQRPNPELCHDVVQDRLVKEVCDLQDSIQDLQKKLSIAENNHQALLSVRADIEADLRTKSTSLFLDRDQCMSLRRGFPVCAAIK